jgi:Mannosyltransferase (PIG-V)
MLRFAKPLPWLLMVWAVSRLVIFGAIALIAPHLPLAPTRYPFTILGFQNDFKPHLDWSLLTHWDGVWYQRIAEQGYGPSQQGMQTVVFFPLYPLLCRALMQLGWSFEVAGTWVSNLSFLGAILLLYDYLETKYDRTIARWSSLVLALFPCALFSAVTYTESLFLLTTIATLISFDARQYGRTALWGALATACRPPGLLLLPALLWASYRDRHPPRAYLASLLTAVGFVGFLGYCAWAYGNPWATFQGHQAWAAGVITWPEVIARLPRWDSQGAGAWVRILSLGGAIALLLRSPQVLTTADRTYGLITLGFLLASNSTEGLIRYLYALAPLSWALGFHLARWKPWRPWAIGAFVLGLVGFSLRFAWWLWVS